MKRISVLLSLAALGACSDREPTSPTKPQQSAAVNYTVSGTLRGPDGTPICDWLPPNRGMFIRVLNTATTPDASVAQQSVTCPTSTYSVSVPEGTGYRLRATVGSTYNSIPFMTLDANTFDVAGAPVTRDLVMTSLAIRGNAVFGGEPLQGSLLSVTSNLTDYANGFAATAVSGPDGRWMQGTHTALLQPGMPYTFTCGAALGLKGLTAPVSGVYPAVVEKVHCRYGVGAPVRWSHTATNLVLTPFAGVFGSVIQFDGGFGWGAQYPVTPGTMPSRNAAASGLFGGSLAFLVNDQLVAADDLGGWGIGTSAAYSVIGSAAAPKSSLLVDGTKRVVANLTHVSGVNTGLEVRQESFDGTMGDYVLMRLVMTNTTTSPMTVHPGIFMDWDLSLVGGNSAANTGGVTLGNRLAYITEAGGTFYGTIILGNWPARGTYLRRQVPGSPVSDDMVRQILRGELNQYSVAQGDLHYLQGVGPVPIRAGRRQQVWLAVVAGSTLSELEANANAAIADHQARTEVSASTAD